MRKFLLKSLITVLLLGLLINSFFIVSVYSAEENKYYLGEAVNTGVDTGYSESNKITESDPHFGWKIGEFFVSGYSDEEKAENNNPIFLKNVGDQITLWFCIEQDINKLNGKDKLTVCDDENGYDEYFGIEKTNFQKGALLIRKKDFENHWSEPVIYTNYLDAKNSEGAYTQVDFFEEGDYEVALNYEIKESNFDIFGWEPLPTYHNYRIFFEFSVRNGNCMVYPFDVATGTELTNLSFTENGFYLDLAKSQYLDINVKKQVLNEFGDGLVEDVRFNKPAKDGEKFTEEGIYIISVSNKYTDQETIKRIYVGNNDILKAHVVTGFTVAEIKQQIELGAYINETGELISVSSQSQGETIENDNKDYIIYILCACAVIVIVIISAMIIVRSVKRKKSQKSEMSSKGDEEK